MSIDFKLGVVGDPVEHSLSPKIHNQFAEQFGHKIDYQKYHISEQEFESFVYDFFNSGGRGLNVTLPHKHSAATIVDELTEQARLTGSVNTISRDNTGRLIGDTTDGKGLVIDLLQKGVDVQGKTVLVIGAGGAAASIIYALLQAGANLKLFNRTESKAKALVKTYSDFGNIALLEPAMSYEILISSVTELDKKLFSQVTQPLMSGTLVYDLNYGQRAESLKVLSHEAGCTNFIDGIGMLIGQAAQSYKIWTGCFPDVSKVML
ncbi:shikimate dehydrogenase [Aliikangiella sp. G2MR2-5]|uniref:shikimate dehydrogenase n=1 Tax=Aliikangiella sp. G2MR2-5 TaxID=2788943 RepID=UPI0018ABF048|nr:shikimate dehydrogenase [Aliikangiella sp. G2MR2-5]